MGDLQAHLPVPRVERSAVFDSNQPDPCAPLSLFTLSCPKCLFFVFLDEKVLKGKRFADVEKVKQKMAEVLKGIKIDEFKNYFKQWNKSHTSQNGHHKPINKQVLAKVVEEREP